MNHLFFLAATILVKELHQRNALAYITEITDYKIPPLLSTSWISKQDAILSHLKLYSGFDSQSSFFWYIQKLAENLPKLQIFLTKSQLDQKECNAKLFTIWTSGTGYTDSSLTDNVDRYFTAQSWKQNMILRRSPWWNSLTDPAKPHFHPTLNKVLLTLLNNLCHPHEKMFVLLSAHAVPRRSIQVLRMLAAKTISAIWTKPSQSWWECSSINWALH